MLRRLLLLLVLLVASGCDHWIEKLEPQETGFARHVFDLLQHRDFATIEGMAGPNLRGGDFSAQLAGMAALIPAETPIASDATSINVSTANGYTKSSVTMVYQFSTGWLELSIASEGRDDARTLTWISLQPTAARGTVDGFVPFLTFIPLVVMVLALIGIIIYRRRAAKRERLETTPEEQQRRQHWSIALGDIGGRTSWFDRVVGIRRITLITTLSADECHRRLSASVASEAVFRLKEPPHSEVQGWVRPSRFRITRKRSMFLSERYPLFLYGDLVADRTGTRVPCRLGPQRLVLGLAAGFLLVVWTMPLAFDVSHGGFTLVSLLGPLMMTGFMALGFSLSSRTTLKAGPHLLDFVAQTLDAAEAPAARSGSTQPVVRR